MVTDLYGDKDLTGTVSGGFGITDVDLAPALTSSWSQTFAPGAYTGASVSIGHSADGLDGPGAVLRLDGVVVGSLTDLDNCGGPGDPGAGCEYIGSLYAIDTFDLSPFLGTLASGTANFSITLNTTGDSWALDFSELTLTAVPEPATLSLLGLAFVGVGAARKRKPA